MSSINQTELTMKQKTLDTLQQPKFNLKDEKKNITEEKRKVVQGIAERMERIKKLVQASIDKEKERRVLHLSFQNIESQNSEQTEKLSELKRKIDEAEAEHKEIKSKWENDKTALQKTHQEARKATGVLSEDVKYKPPESWQVEHLSPVRRAPI